MADIEPNDLPAFRAWSERYEPRPDAAAYLSEHLSVTAARLFADVMLPELVMVQGCVILKSRYAAETFADWWTREQGDVQAVQRALNRLHLWDLFEPADAAEERALHELGERIASTWQWHAERCFPSQRFVASVTDDYGPTVVLVSASGGAPA